MVVPVTVACGARQRRVSNTQCATCPDYTRVSVNGLKCEPCPTGMLTAVDGKCSNCPAGQVLTKDGRSCMVLCASNEKRLSPTKCEACPVYTKLSSNKDSCEPCPAGWVASPLGLCSQCPVGFVTTDQRTCQRKVICPPYTRLSADGTNCVTCPLDQIASADG